jgi:hypothetical protein
MLIAIRSYFDRVFKEASTGFEMDATAFVFLFFWMKQSNLASTTE